MKTKLELPEAAYGLRIDKALGTYADLGSRSRAEHLIDSGAVFVNGQSVKSSYQVKSTDVIEIELPTETPIALTGFDHPLEILFEDKDLIVVNKSSGLVVHPAAGHQEDTLVNILIGQSKDLSMKFGENRPGIVHRLDKDTSGILVVAKNDFAHEGLAAQFKDKTAHRIYHAVCFGVPHKKQFTLQSNLARHPTDRKRMASVRDPQRKIIPVPQPEGPGKWAVTHVDVLKTHVSGLSYLKLKLETGRTHQIRVHLSEQGHAIVGDPIYSSSRDFSKIKSLETRTKAESIPHLALHAAELGFVHPRTQEQLSFKSTWPDEMIFPLRFLGFL